jgi:predicted  nucleic acid-binding Zn-ribbon protein
MIRKIFTTVIACLTPLIFLFAQPKIEVTESQTMLEKGTFPSFDIILKDVSIKDVDKILRGNYKDQKAKVSGSYKSELFIEDIQMGDISELPIDVYMKLMEMNKDVKISTLYEIDSAVFISSATHPELASLVEKRLIRLGLKVEKYKVEEELKAANDVLKSMEGDLKGLRKDNDKMHEKISGNEREIDRTKGDIRMNLGDQERKREEINTQKDHIGGINPALEDEVKFAEKNLKSFESELKKQEKENEKMHKSIEKMESEIRDTEREIDKNLDEQKGKNREIDSQNDIIKEIESRLRKFE